MNDKTPRRRVRRAARQKPRARALNRISGVGGPDAGRLLEQNVETLDDLWGGGGSGLADRLNRTARASGVSRELLYGVLVGDALGVLRQKNPARRFLAAAGRRKGGLALGAVLLLAVSLLAYRLLTAGESVAPLVKVRAGSKLAAFRPIEAADLTLAKGGGQESSFSAVDHVVGRYPSDTVPGGTPVTEKLLLGKEWSGELGRRHLLTLAVKHGTPGQSIKTPAGVWLLFPPPDEKNSSALLVDDVMLLAVRQDGERVTADVALTESGFTRMRDYVGRTDAVVVQPAAQQVVSPPPAGSP